MDAGQDLPGASAAAQACSTGDQQVAYAAVDAAQPAQIPDAPSHGAAGAAAQQCGPGSDTAGQPAQPTEVKRKRGRPVGSLNRKTLERLERARMQEQKPAVKYLQLPCGVPGKGEGSEAKPPVRPEALAAAAANLGLPAWPPRMPLQPQPAGHSAQAQARAAPQHHAAQLQLLLGQPYMPVSAAASAGQGGGEGMSAAHPASKGLSELVSTIAGMAMHAPAGGTGIPGYEGLLGAPATAGASSAAPAQQHVDVQVPEEQRPEQPAGSKESSGAITLQVTGTLQQGQEVPQKRPRGRPPGSKNKATLATLAAQQKALGWIAQLAPALAAVPASSAAQQPAHGQAGPSLPAGSMLPAMSAAACAQSSGWLQSVEGLGAGSEDAPDQAASLPEGQAVQSKRAEAQPPAAPMASPVGSGGASPGGQPRKRGRPKGSKDSKPRRPRVSKQHSPPPLQAQSSLVPAAGV